MNNGFVLGNILNHRPWLLYEPKGEYFVEVAAQSRVDLYLFWFLYKHHDLIQYLVLVIIKNGLFHEWGIDAEGLAHDEGQTEHSGGAVAETRLLEDQFYHLE